jgi:hypothetical protein
LDGAAQDEQVERKNDSTHIDPRLLETSTEIDSDTHPRPDSPYSVIGGVARNRRARTSTEPRHRSPISSSQTTQATSFNGLLKSSNDVQKEIQRQRMENHRLKQDVRQLRDENRNEFVNLRNENRNLKQELSNTKPVCEPHKFI